MASTCTTGSKRKIEVMGAFHEFAPSATTSASKRIKKPSYDVFINHRGPDVKHTLASVLYSMLTAMALSVFLDSEELEYGDFLPRTIEAAMKGALLHIAIFSKSYAESPWCLAELSFMLKSGATIIPIFYHVDPTDLRYIDQGKGIYVDAFNKHEQKGRYSMKLLQEWKKALHVVSYHNGQIIKTDEDETRLLKNIERCVLKVINNVPLVVAKHPVGLEEIVQDFEMNTLQSAQSDEDVQIVGIWGMGGSGKTTLAKELYNKRSSSMERFSFVFDVRDAATKGLLHEKQKKLLNDLGVQGSAFDNIDEGMRALSRHLRSARMLIVLDDVDNVEQLDALLLRKDSLETTLERGSLIIVTTRELDVLRSWGITSVYKMEPLDPLYAMQLFCWHAFLQSFPRDGFERIVEIFLKACQGLPLSLKVFGGQLYGESRKEHWESLLHNISRILSPDIRKTLKVSYDALNFEEKHMFLDIACFLIGEESSLAIEIWNGLGYSGLYSWERLLDKCLVEVDSENLIRMHDHLRDLGKEIANQESPYRLGLPQQIIDVQKYQEKRIGIRGIRATSNQIGWDNYEEEKERFPVMERTYKVDDTPVRCSRGELMVNTNCGIWSLAPSSLGLNFFVISGDYFNEVMGQVSTELIWLRWFQIGQRNLPSGISLKKLRVLELHEDRWGSEHQLEELWVETEDEAPVQLRELRISCCHKFQGFPNSIGRLNQLKKIVIIDGYNVRSLPDEFCLLQSLEHLVLDSCKMLSSLPDNFGQLRNLRHLCLPSCSKLRSLPDSFKNLMLLKYLNLRGCSEVTLTSDILENITKLDFLSLSECAQLEELPRHITNQASLRELCLKGTRLRELPVNIGQLSRLREMTIESVFSTSLPFSLGDLSSLTNLSIKACSKLKCLPDSLGDLSSLTNLEIKDCPKLEREGVKTLPKSIRQLNNLQRLMIFSCPISELEFGAASSNLKKIYLFGTEVCRITFSQDSCPHLEGLYVYDNHHLEEIDALPRTVESIYLVNCEMLNSIPNFVQLTSLRIFELRGSNRIQKIEGLENCTRLERLRVDSCWEVPGIESLKHMEKLSSVKLRANKGSAIQRCIQTIEKWPDEMVICMRLVPDASSVVDSLLSPNLMVVDSFSNHKMVQKPYSPISWPKLVVQKPYSPISWPKLVVQKPSSPISWPKFVVQKPSSNGDAFMLCFVINCVSSQMTLDISASPFDYRSKFEKGRWALVRVLTRPTSSVSICGCEGENEVEKGLVVRGEKQTVVEAFHSLFTLLQS